jgi:riboflavin synthase
VFTGLVEELGRVAAVDRTAEGARVTVDAALAGELAHGDSVAVNGVCLTATRIENGGFSADVMEETLRRSSLEQLGAGSRVNLELPMRPADRLGGHIVQGHVDGVGEIAGVSPEGMSRVVRVACDPSLLRYVVEKGSIAVDGISLTVSALHDDGFEVSLIPETLERTTLGAAETGTQVNLEVDVLAKHVERLMQWGAGAGHVASEGGPPEVLT